MAGPPDHRWHAISALPVGVLLVAKRSHAGIWPGIHMRAVVSAVKKDRVIGDAELIEDVKHLANVLVVIDHHVMIFGLPAPGLTSAFRLLVSAKMHMGGVHPDKERFARLMLALDEVDGGCLKFIVYRFHSLLGERPCIFYSLGAIRICPAMQDTARTILFSEIREILLGRIIAQLRLFFRVQVIEVSKELIKSMHGRQMFITIAKMVLAELPCGVAERF